MTFFIFLFINSLSLEVFKKILLVLCLNRDIIAVAAKRYKRQKILRMNPFTFWVRPLPDEKLLSSYTHTHKPHLN